MTDGTCRSCADPAVATVAAAGVTGRVDYPMFVVTATDGTGPGGCLAGFVTQCSILPTRFLVCVSRENHTMALAARASALGLHLLGRDQLDVARVFGEMTGDRTDKFARVPWRSGVTGVPVLARCAAWLEGRVIERVDLGDHVGHVLDPVAGGGGGAAGQLWYSAARHLHAGHPPGG
jgi:flavin reductase (DIM6/NTAB) family NADH-FMN oxidoreductase RutF